jgi:CheY-like chemotaxis protein
MRSGWDMCKRSLINLRQFREEAVELLAEDAFALAILDIRMAGMDGFEL